ncbi:MAG: hypothetical protein ACRDGD_00480 [Candidatus Limnocylindria bacterium]
MPNASRVFIVARNPEPDSRLPYLLRLPMADPPILKAPDTWPRTARVFCHRTDEWPEDAEILEEVPVLGCVRRGVAIDLVLDRPLLASVERKSLADLAGSLNNGSLVFELGKSSASWRSCRAPQWSSRTDTRG